MLSELLLVAYGRLRNHHEELGTFGVNVKTSDIALGPRDLDGFAAFAVPLPHLPDPRILPSTINVLTIRGPLWVFRWPLVHTVPAGWAGGPQADGFAALFRTYDKQATAVAVRFISCLPQHKGHVFPVR